MRKGDGPTAEHHRHPYGQLIQTPLPSICALPASDPRDDCDAGIDAGCDTSEKDRCEGARDGDEGAPVAKARAAGLSWLAAASEETDRVGLTGVGEGAREAPCAEAAPPARAPARLANFTFDTIGLSISSTLSTPDQNPPDAGAKGSGRTARCGAVRSSERYLAANSQKPATAAWRSNSRMAVLAEAKL